MRLVITVSALMLVLVIAVCAYLLLQSCGVRLPLTGTVLSACETEEALETRDALAATWAANDDLDQQIIQLERELALLACKAEPPAQPPPPPPPPPPKPKTPSGLPPDAFKKNDISVMKGCWELSSNYDVRDIRSGKITRFRYWQICFDAKGNGREVMRATNGVRCEGRLTGRLGSGRLSMREPGNLQCSNGSEIFRRDITCSLNARGTATCDTYQPEINGRGRATLRRAGR